MLIFCFIYLRAAERNLDGYFFVLKIKIKYKNSEGQLILNCIKELYKSD